jgi:hypothetical protein
MFSVSRRLVAILLALVAIGAGFYAAYSIVVIQKSIVGTSSINASPGLSVLDSACSAQLSSLSFSSLGANTGSSVSLTVCVKNTGGGAFYLDSNPTSPALPSVSFSGLPSGVAGVSSLTTAQQLASGATYTLTLTLTNNGSTTTGAFTFTVTFTGYSTSTG